MKFKSFILVFLLLASLCTLSACGFVSFHNEEVDSDEDLALLKSSYIQELTKKDINGIYYYEEYKEYLYILNESINKINACTSVESLNQEFADSKLLISNVKTIEQYKKEALELKVAKDDYIFKLETVISDVSLYRPQQRNEIESLVNEGTNCILSNKQIADLAEIFELYKAKLNVIKTDSQLYKEECEQAALNYYLVWKSIMSIDTFSNDDKSEIELVYSQMKSVNSIEKINELFVNTSEDMFTKETLLSQDALVGLKELFELLVVQYANCLYVDTESENVRDNISQALLLIENAESHFDLKSIFADYKSNIDGIKTIDLAWQEQDEEFVRYMQNKYGEYMLPMPASLTQANDYEELAQIIDYYVFYQLDQFTFERSKFRVKLNWETNNSARYEYNNAYWKSKLLRGAADANCKYENGYLVIELIPYNFASVESGASKPALTRKTTNVVFKSTATQTREDDYDDFAINKYEKHVIVWNSQQLWYVLQKDCYPECVEGSIAEICLNEAKSVLREIIKNDMDELEKIYQVFLWFGENVSYDNGVYDYLDSSNSEYYPSEGFSALRSFCVEGALIDKLAVCSGYAKAALVLMKLEGIESTHILAKHRSIANVNSIFADNGGVGSHEFLYIKMEDEWYYFDCEKSFAGSDASFVSVLYLLASPSMQSYGAPDLIFDNEAKDIYRKIYDKLKFDNYNVYIKDITDIEPFVESFLQLEEGNCVSMIVDSSIFSQARSIIDGYAVEKTFMRVDNNEYSVYEIIIGK